MPPPCHQPHNYILWTCNRGPGRQDRAFPHAANVGRNSCASLDTSCWGRGATAGEACCLHFLLVSYLESIWLAANLPVNLIQQAASYDNLGQTTRHSHNGGPISKVSCRPMQLYWAPCLGKPNSTGLQWGSFYTIFVKVKIAAVSHGGRKKEEKLA